MPDRASPKERLDQLIKDKKLSNIKIGSDKSLIPVFHSTGIPQLDEIIGGGLAENRMYLFYGESSHGKSFVSQVIAAQYQSEGRLVALVDAEQSFDPRWWTATNVDTELLLVQRPAGGEAAVMAIEALIGKVDLLIVDSIDALVPLVISELDVTKKATMGRHAQLVTTLIHKCLAKLDDSGTTIIFINQVRDNFESQYVVQLPGGRAQRFYSAVMLEISRREWLKNSAGDKTGFMMNVKVEKNKLGLAQRSVLLPVSLEGRFDFITLLVSDALDRGIVQNAGAYYRLPSELPIEVIPEGIKYKVLEDTQQHQVMGKDAVYSLLEQNEQSARILEFMVYGAKEVA